MCFGNAYPPSRLGQACFSGYAPHCWRGARQGRCEHPSWCSDEYDGMQDSQNRAIDASVVDLCTPWVKRSLSVRERSRRPLLLLGRALDLCLSLALPTCSVVSELAQPTMYPLWRSTWTPAWAYGASFRAYWNRTLALTAVVSSCRELWSANESLRRDRPARAIKNRSGCMGFLAYESVIIAAKTSSGIIAFIVFATYLPLAFTATTSS